MRCKFAPANSFEAELITGHGVHGGRPFSVAPLELRAEDWTMNRTSALVVAPVVRLVAVTRSSW